MGTHPNDHNILVVDDDEGIRELFARYLEDEGYRVILAKSGAEALQLVAEEGIDLVILDVRMPGLSGLEVLESLRRSYTPDELPVIMATGLDDSDDVVQAFDKGANDYVTKPFKVPVVLARLQTRLRSKVSPTERSISDQESGAEIGPGTILEGKYRLESQIGEGQFGVVFRATQIELQRAVAVKVLRTGADNDGTLRARFQQEGMAACRIEHPNAVAILDFSFTAAGRPYLVMELLEGHSLDDEIACSGHLTPWRSAEVLKPVCDVLAEAHDLGILHRDIKPQNVFLQRKRGIETVKVLDFGLARLMEGVGWHRSSGAASRGIGPGTPLYMAPERFCELPCDGRSDVYSLGVTLYEMLSGHPPFRAINSSPLAVARLHLSEPPRSLRRMRPEIPEAIDRLVLRTLAKTPEERPGIRDLAREFVAALPPDDTGQNGRGRALSPAGTGGGLLCCQRSELPGRSSNLRLL